MEEQALYIYRARDVKTQHGKNSIDKAKASTVVI
jgi:hypothetical protein